MMINRSTLFIVSFICAASASCLTEKYKLNISEVASLHDERAFTQVDRTHSQVNNESLVHLLVQKARSAVQAEKTAEKQNTYLYCDETGAIVSVFWEKRSFRFLAIPATIQNLSLKPESKESLKAKGVDIDLWIEFDKLRAKLRGYPGSKMGQIAIIRN